jgi:hypothetical protein
MPSYSSDTEYTEREPKKRKTREQNKRKKQENKIKGNTDLEQNRKEGEKRGIASCFDQHQLCNQKTGTFAL